MIKKIKTKIIFFKEFKNIKKQSDICINAGETFIGTIDLEFIQKKIFCKIINDDKWLFLKSKYKN